MTQPPTNNSLVSIRIPKSLLAELRKRAEQGHFLDVSEHVRSIVRNKWQEARDPQAYQVKKLRKEIVAAIGKKSDEKTQAQLIKELERIKEALVR